MRHRRRPYRDYEDDESDSIGETLADVNDRLDDLSRKIARIARRSPEDEEVPASLEDALARFDRRLDEIVNTEHAARTNHAREERVLRAAETAPRFEAGPPLRQDYQPEPAARVAAPPAAPAELTVDLSGLENQLRQITQQISSLNQQPCQIHDAVGALRNDLVQIGRSVSESMPRNEIVALEKEVRGLGERVARSGDNSANIAKFTQLEKQLADIREFLRGMKPTEHHQEISAAVKNLALRMEQVSASTQNPASLQKLEQALVGLRTIVSHAASNDAVGKLADEVRGLSARVEQSITENNATVDDSAALQKLEEAMAGLGTMVSHTASNDAVGQLAQEVRALATRVDQSIANGMSGLGTMVSHTASNDAVGQLAQEVRALATRVDQAIANGMSVVGTTAPHAASNDAVDQLSEEIRALGERVDHAIANGSGSATNDNPAAMEKVEQAVTSLRAVVSHVASNDTVGQLAEEMRGLSARIEQTIADHTTYAVSTIDQQIQSLTAGTAAAAANVSVPALELEGLIRSLSEQINHVQTSQAQLSEGDKLALSSIEDHIVKLSSKLDTSDVMLARLGAIERGMADVLLYLERQRLLDEQRRHAAQQLILARQNDMRRDNGHAPNHAPHHYAPLAPQHEPHRDQHDEPPAVAHQEHAAHEEPRHEPPVEPSQEQRINSAAGAPASTTSELASAHREPEVADMPVPAAQFSAPEHVIQPSETPAVNGTPSFPHALSAPPESESTEASALDALNAAANALALSTKAEAPHAAIRRPINPDLPPDTPIEPNPEGGQNRASAADRIAASEEALGPAKPAAREVATQFETLIAARRAAFAAGSEAEPEAAPFKPAFTRPEAERGRRFGSYLRWVLFAASIIIILLGAARVAMEMWHVSEPSAPSMPADASAPSSLPAPTPNQLNGSPDSRPAPVMPMPGPESLPEPPRGDTPSAPPAAGPNPPQISPPEAPNNEGTSKPDPLGDAGSVKPMPEVTGALTRQGPDIDRVVGPAALPITIGGPVLRQAANTGNAAAEYEVAVRYSEGRGVTVNVEESARWLERSAKAGFAPALFRLGGLYDKGGALKRDRALARTLYTAAAEKGHAKAMHNLAVLYAEGIDGRPNYKMAAQWFRGAADHGIADSQYNLAILYIRGIGVDQNLSEAYKWFALAANQGDQEAARKRDEVAERLDAPSLNSAQLAVQNFRALTQPEQAVSLRIPAGGWDKATTSVQPTRPGQRPGESSVPNPALLPAPL